MWLVILFIGGPSRLCLRAGLAHESGQGALQSGYDQIRSSRSRNLIKLPRSAKILAISAAAPRPPCAPDLRPCAISRSIASGQSHRRSPARIAASASLWASGSAADFRPLRADTTRKRRPEPQPEKSAPYLAAPPPPMPHTTQSGRRGCFPDRLAPHRRGDGPASTRCIQSRLKPRRSGRGVTAATRQVRARSRLDGQAGKGRPDQGIEGVRLRHGHAAVALGIRALRRSGGGSPRARGSCRPEVAPPDPEWSPGWPGSDGHQDHVAQLRIDDLVAGNFARIWIMKPPPFCAIF